MLCLLQGSLRELRLAADITGTQDGRQRHRADIGVADASALMLNNGGPGQQTTVCTDSSV